MVQQKGKGKDRTSENHERRECRQNECLLNNAGLCVLFGALEKIIVVLLYGSDFLFCVLFSVVYLEPCVFACVVYCHLHAHQRKKLESRALKCVFVRYNSTQKGYWCYHPPSKWFFMSMDVIFHEHELLYATVVIDLSLEGRSTHEVQNHIDEYVFVRYTIS